MAFDALAGSLDDDNATVRTWSLQALAAELLPWLDEMGEAQTARDWVRLADLLEYEIEPRVESVATWLDALATASGARGID